MAKHITNELIREIQAYANVNRKRFLVKINEQKAFDGSGCSHNLLNFPNGINGCDYEQNFPLKDAGICDLDFNSKGLSVVDFNRYEYDRETSDFQGDLIDNFQVTFKYNGKKVIIIEKKGL